MFNHDKDERALAVEKSSYTLAYKVMAFALCADVIFRSIVLKSESWDLLGIVILGGVVATIYQLRYKTATHWVRATLASVFLAIVLAVVIVLLFRSKG